MKKTDFVREVYEENRNSSNNPVGQSMFSRMFAIARSSISYVSLMDEKDAREKQKLDIIHQEHPWYGHRRIGWSLGYSMKRTRRLMKKFCITALRKKARQFIKPDDQQKGDMHGKYIG